jgi:hypothetical protein
MARIMAKKQPSSSSTHIAGPSLRRLKFIGKVRRAAPAHFALRYSDAAKTCKNQCADKPLRPKEASERQFALSRHPSKVIASKLAPHAKWPHDSAAKKFASSTSGAARRHRPPGRSTRVAATRLGDKANRSAAVLGMVVQSTRCPTEDQIADGWGAASSKTKREQGGEPDIEMGREMPPNALRRGFRGGQIVRGGILSMHSEIAPDGSLLSDYAAIAMHGGNRSKEPNNEVNPAGLLYAGWAPFMSALSCHAA